VGKTQSFKATLLHRVNSSHSGYSPPASAEVKKTWIYTFTPPYAFIVQCSSKRERQDKEDWEVVRNITFWGVGKELYFRFWRFPGSARSFILVEVMHMIGFLDVEGQH
jgi:hypothetical protein